MAGPVSTIPDDTLIYPIVSDLAACLCAEFAGESLCFCGIEPAAGVPIEIGGCDESGSCGAVSVRLVRLFPSTSFPDPDRSAVCGTLLAAELMVSAYRCTPVGHEDGSGPTQEEYAAWSLQQYADMMALRRAIACCFAGQHADVEYILNGFTPIPAQGGIAGGQWNLIVRQAF